MWNLIVKIDREEEELIDDSDDNTPEELAARMKFDATITLSGKSLIYSIFWSICIYIHRCLCYW